MGKRFNLHFTAWEKLRIWLWGKLGLHKRVYQIIRKKFPDDFLTRAG